MRFWSLLLTMVALATAQTFSPIIQVDGLGISNLHKDMDKPILQLGYGELGAKFEDGPFTFTGSLNVDENFDLSVKDIKAQYQAIDQFGVYVGHTEQPFGSYQSNAVSYSYLRGLEREHDMMFGVTGTFANEHLTYNVAGISSDTVKLNTGAAKLEYTSKYVNSDVSVKTNMDTTAFALGVTVKPVYIMDATFRGYKGVNTDMQAGMTELNFYSTDWIVHTVRWDVMGDKVSGKSQASLSTLFFLNNHVTMGVEYAILNDIYNKDFHNTVNQASIMASFLW